jgi:hypothetical protein
MKTINQLDVVEFSEYESVEPKDLISFSREYNENLNVLVSTIRSANDKNITLSIARIESDGGWGKKDITGSVKDPSDLNFIFVSNHDFYGTYDYKKETLIHFNNVLGDVPMLPTFTFCPYEVDDLDSQKSYFLKLEEMKELLKSSIDAAHSAKLFYRFDKNHTNYRENGFVVECEIKEVNKSNLKIFHLRTSSFGGEENSLVDLTQGDKVQRFISPNCFLYKVSVSWGLKNKINLCDEE